MTIIDVIKPLLPDVQENQPMHRHTSFKIGGNAEVLARPKTINQLTSVWKICKEKNIPITILGDGTNVLIADEGLKGVVVITNKMTSLEFLDNNRINAAAGVRLAKLAEEACNANLNGLAFASGIPGTVGGAIYMNAGAYGYDIGNFCESVTMLIDNKIITESAEKMDFGYRKSIAQVNNALILSGTFKLSQGNAEEIRAEMNRLNSKRKASQPLEYPSAGSTFKRPEGYYAGKLIEDSGLKGFKIGGAEVSEKHAGFVINRGGATADDVKKLIEEVRQQVNNKFGVWLEPEVRVMPAEQDI